MIDCRSNEFPLLPGAMIAPNIALTAGHCMASGIPSNWLVRTYRYRDSLSTKSEGGIIYTVLRAYVHPNYRESAYPWDYAVVILGPPTNYGKFTPQFIAINRDPAVPTHWESARTMGWGLVADGGTASDILRQVDIRTASPEFCKSQLGSSYGNPTYLCAGSPGKDSCQGDSGGPLVIRRNNQWLLVGLVSFGAAGCADPVDYLAVYSRISTVANWIDGIVASHPPPKVTTTKAPKTTMCTYCYAATCKRKAPKTKRGLEMVSAPMEKTVTRVVTVTETKTETATVCPAA